MNRPEILLHGMCVMFCVVLGATASAEPITYNIDSAHTFPSIAADHASGFSIWRGKINETSGVIVLDTEAESGTVEVLMQMASIDFGYEPFNDHAKNEDFFHVDRYPTATYTGALVEFEDGAPTAVEGELAMVGITLPLNLEIVSLVCIDAHRATNRPACGA